jgi:hypothetical protein
VYGIPNGDSIGGFIRRFGWTSLASWGDELLDSAISLMKHANADVILAWALELNSTHTSLRRQGFRNIPSRLSPIELHLGYRSLNTSEKPARHDWAFSYLDSDTV